MSCGKKKSSWPELFGAPAGASDDVKLVILSDNDDVTLVQIVDQHEFVTDDFRCDRVRVFVDKKGSVAEVPRVG